MAFKEAAKEFLSFVNHSQSPFHAVREARLRLVNAGFVELKEKDHWNIQPNGKYFFTRNQSTLIAFAVGGKNVPGNGFSIIGAHTDSPCLKIKPKSSMNKSGYLAVGVETYGGGIWHTWFDRDLGFAGRVIVKQHDEIVSKLVTVNRPVLRIPTLAIHLDRSVNEQFKFNKETELVPILALSRDESKEKKTDEQPAKKKKEASVPTSSKHHVQLLQLISEELQCDIEDIVDVDLCLADTLPGALGGVDEEFIFSPRLDNLVNSFCSLKALIDTCDSLHDEPLVRVCCLYDNEEVGSESAQGAASAITEFVLRRLSPGETTFEEAIAKSFLISADMAHAIHPNYSCKHESNHTPRINEGVVIKFNCNQRYATTVATAAILKECAHMAHVSIQEFVVRNDSPCGSTIGPILSSRLALRTIDVGNPQLSMHSIREMCGTEDIHHAISLFKAFYAHFAAIDKRVKID